MTKEAGKQKKTHEIIYAILKLKYKSYILASLAGLTILFGTYGFLDKGLHPTTGILNSIKMFGLDYPSQWSEINWQIFTAIILAIITISFVAVMLLIKDSYDKYMITDIFSSKHNVLFGLGGVSISFLNSYPQQKGQPGVVVIESDPNNKNIEECRKKGVGVFVGDAFNDDNLNKLNLKNMENAVIALGNDRVNIELAKRLINLYEQQQLENTIKIIIHIQNRDLDILFHRQFIIPDEDKDLNIDIKTFSFFQEVAKDLFENHDVDGGSDRFINTNDSFCSILIGDGELVQNVIYQMAQVSHLPNENKHTVYVVDKDADNLLIRIKKHLYYIEDNFPKFRLEAKSLDSNSLEFFSNSIWQKNNIANIIIAYDTEGENLDIAIELFNRVYLSRSVDNDQGIPKILFAIYDQHLLAKMVKEDNDTLKNFYAFGNSNNVMSSRNLIEEEKDLIAKLIHFSYGDLYNPDILNYDEIKTNRKWYNRNKYSNKLSSVGQANHIDMKLKAMGLKKQKSTQVSKTKEELRKQNRDVLSNILDNERSKLGIGDIELVEYSKELKKFYDKKKYDIKYFPEAYTTRFEKMIRMEHNRWNAFHYLNGWKYSETKNKDKKEHDCLMPLENFKDDKLRITVIYDIYSFLYLPNYLAEAGYEIVSLNNEPSSLSL